MTVKTFDAKCHDLARAFLSDEPPDMRSERDANELARAIQEAIENWIADRRNAR